MLLLTEEIENKWKKIVDHSALSPIKDHYKKAVITCLLENQESFLREAAQETTSVQNYDPVVISLVRRTMPNIVAFDITGVQPMNGPTGLIFAMRSMYGSAPDMTTDPSPAWKEAGKAPNEAFMDVPDTTYSGSRTTQAAEHQGRGQVGDDIFADMSFVIEKSTVTARSRALRAEYTLELAQDLKAIHGLEAESELSNILSVEIMNEINRELFVTVKNAAKLAKGEPEYATGAPTGVTSAAGTWDISANSDGRWSAEKYKSLLVKINKEANAIAKDTRRGRGNFIICSSDVASVLDLTGKMEYSPELVSNLNADDVGNTFAGTLNGRYKVFIDQYASDDFIVVGYKGASAYDAGAFYCPYVPLQMVKAISPTTFQPSFGFKTRYALTANPFTTLTANKNTYFRKFVITNL